MGTVNISLPTKWIDLSNSQLLFVAKLFHSDFASLKTQFLTHAFVFFSGARILGEPFLDLHLIKFKKQKSVEMSVSLLLSIANKLDWLLLDVTELKPLKRIFFASPVNYRMYHTCFEQFLTAENYYIAYSETNNIKFLDMLVASLYLLPFQRFNAKKVQSRSKWFSLVSPFVKYTVFLWYTGFRTHISNEFDDLFTVSKKKGSSVSIKVKSHIMSFVRGLTEGDITKTNSVYKSDTWTALFELNEKAKQGSKTKK